MVEVDWSIAVPGDGGDGVVAVPPNATFDALMEAATAAVDATVPGVYERYGTGRSDGRWDCDDETGALWFTKAVGRVAETRFQDVATWSPQDATLKRGWDHPRATPAIRQGAERVFAKGEALGAAALTTALPRVGEHDTWHLAKLTAFLSDLPALYRARVNDTVFLSMAFAEPRWRDA